MVFCICQRIARKPCVSQEPFANGRGDAEAINSHVDSHMINPARSCEFWAPKKHIQSSFNQASIYDPEAKLSTRPIIDRSSLAVLPLVLYKQDHASLHHLIVVELHMSGVSSYRTC